MKKGWNLVLLAVLLIGLIAGGSYLYPKLLPDAADHNDVEPSNHHQEERQSVETPAAEEQIPVTAEPAESRTPEESPDAFQTPDFHVQDENGQEVCLSEFFGKPVVVNFWATWCPPCRMELPYFDEAAKQYAGQVEFMMVNLTDGYTDTVESATAFIREENGYSFPLFFDVAFEAVEAYQINAIPVTLFIRADGTLLHQQIGSMDEETLLGYMEQLLEQS